MCSASFQELHHWPRTVRQSLLHRHCDKPLGLRVGLLPTGGLHRQTEPAHAHSLDGLGERPIGKIL